MPDDSKPKPDLRTTEGADAFVKQTFESLSSHLSSTGRFPAPYALVLVTLNPGWLESTTTMAKLAKGGIVRVESTTGAWEPDSVRDTARKIATLYEAVGAAMVFPMLLAVESEGSQPVVVTAETGLQSIGMQFEHRLTGERLFVAEVKEKDGQYSLGEANEPYPGWRVDAGGRILFPDTPRTLH